MRKEASELNILDAANRAAWRAWLKANFKTAREVWLVFYRKGSGKARIPYNDAVEEALCFGWIDSNVRRLDDERFVQRFSPRRPGSAYSPANLERLKRLVAQRKVEKSVAASLPALNDTRRPRLVVAPDILAAIKADPQA